MVPFGTGVLVQPVAGSHESAVHGLESLQTSGVPGVHTPPWHISAPLQALPSLQLVPSDTGGFEQVPVAGSQVPALWQASWAVQTTPGPGIQTPLVHWSFCVHGLPSSHAVPSETGGFEQVPVAGSQVPAE